MLDLAKNENERSHMGKHTHNGLMIIDYKFLKLTCNLPREVV